VNLLDHCGLEEEAWRTRHTAAARQDTAPFSHGIFDLCKRVIEPSLVDDWADVYTGFESWAKL
jgi:hypothetical protein